MLTFSSMYILIIKRRLCKELEDLFILLNKNAFLIKSFFELQNFVPVL